MFHCLTYSVLVNGSRNVIGSGFHVFLSPVSYTHLDVYKRQTQMWTISALQMHEKGIIVCDDAATAELKVGTYRYFKDIESAHLDPESLIK